jgi:hypothetical protein
MVPASSRRWFWPAVSATVAVLLILSGAYVAQKLVWEQNLQTIASGQMSTLGREGAMLALRFRTRANDLYFLKAILEENLAHHQDGAAALRLAAEKLMLSRGVYDSVRLLNPAGRETFRVNLIQHGENQPPTIREVPPAELQDKSGRPFYQETLQSPPGAAVFSRFDLNVDHGKIEMPPKPVVRISCQILRPDGTLHSLLVMNYLGDYLLHNLIKQSWLPLLLNADGQWLIGPKENATPGLLLDPLHPPLPISSSDPSLWKQLQRPGDSGWVFEKGRLLCFQRIDPLAEPLEYPLIRMPIAGSERLRMTLVEEIPESALWEKIAFLRRSIWLGSLLGCLIFAPLAWIGVASLREVASMRRRLDRIMQRHPGPARPAGQKRRRLRPAHSLGERNERRVPGL